MCAPPSCRSVVRTPERRGDGAERLTPHVHVAACCGVPRRPFQHAWGFDGVTAYARVARAVAGAALYNKQMVPPDGVPPLEKDDDHSYFPTYPDSQEESGPLLDAGKQGLFDYWTAHK